MPTASRAGDSTHENAGGQPVPAGDIAGGADESIAGGVDESTAEGGAQSTAGSRAQSTAEEVRPATAAWRAPAGLVIVAATAAGLALRVLLLTRPGFLTSGVVEYDDGVYLGAAIRLLRGTLPYRDFAYVQPPGILVLALPFALVAKAVSAPAGLAAGRIVTALVSAACIPLAGRLVRHKGAVATLVTCGFLAVYPADVLTARTLLLEPWMNLCCLLAANAAFASGRLATGRRLAWAGVALGFAASVKLWAAVPAAVLLCCLLARGPRKRRAGAYLAGLAAGFVPPAAAFAAAAPGAFLRQTVFDQVTRMGSHTSLTARLDYLTGLLPIMNRYGTPHVTAGPHSMFAVGSTAATVTGGTGWLPYAVAALAATVLVAAHLRRPASRPPLDWFALAVAAASIAAVTLYSAFFYHYPAFPAPWLAIASGTAAATLASLLPAPATGRASGRATGTAAGTAAGRATGTVGGTTADRVAGRVIVPATGRAADSVAGTAAADSVAGTAAGRAGHPAAGAGHPTAGSMTGTAAGGAAHPAADRVGDPAADSMTGTAADSVGDLAADAARGAARDLAGQRDGVPRGVMAARIRFPRGPAASRAVTARKVVAAGAAVIIIAAAALEGSQLAAQRAPSSPRAAARVIPAGACVVTDQVSFLIAANRFAPVPGCPAILDSLAETLTLSSGVSVPGGAGRIPRVTAGWEAVFGRAAFVWLTQGYRSRIPWTPALRSWFTARFRLVATFRSYGDSHLYERR